MRTLLLLVTVVWMSGLAVEAADTDADVALPKLPALYKAYEIDPDTVSPDKQYALMYPSAPPEDDSTEVKNFVVALKPFRVVVELPKGDDTYFADRSNAEIAAVWSKDSSLLMVMQGSRWGPGSVYVMPIHDGKAGKLTELTAEVIKLATPDFKKVEADPYNDNYPFVLVGDNAWPINAKGQVVIDVDCATNPKKMSDTKSWAGTFHGVWDVAQGKFVEGKFKRTFSGVYSDN